MSLLALAAREPVRHGAVHTNARIVALLDAEVADVPKRPTSA